MADRRGQRGRFIGWSWTTSILGYHLSSQFCTQRKVCKVTRSVRLRPLEWRAPIHSALKSLVFVQITPASTELNNRRVVAQESRWLGSMRSSKYSSTTSWRTNKQSVQFGSVAVRLLKNAWPAVSGQIRSVDPQSAESA